MNKNVTKKVNETLENTNNKTNYIGDKKMNIKTTKKVKESVIDHVKKHGTLLDDNVTYNEERYSFNMIKQMSTVSGVYIIMDKNGNILKFGKAEGKEGLKDRMGTYRAKLALNDRTTIMWNRVMTNELKDEILKVYYIECPPITEMRNGIEVDAEWARSYEEKLSRWAAEEGHSLALSKGH